MSYMEAITHEDRYYVKRSVILPMVIAAFERDSRHMEQHLRTPGPYVDAVKLAISRAWEEHKFVKKHFWDKGLKVYEQTNYEHHIHVKFKCRGYESDMELQWAFVTGEASVLMRKYLGLDVSIYESKDGPENTWEKY
ncbi:hypothetical protein JCM10914A_55600 [Paenibacillus sp. JCM 10914]|uniref:hypothetical protein n=1 Tax=Paenibacillus sp. JCM 10914 TaxID=1236974 RepID=UPI0003CC8028|nr:hypothetical protein [Paenibacillus sp. JCM 10914]GAE09636.1 hypothetical protein JCM10914_6008 [Paenibacillus sp. JCM 10914]